MKLMVLGILSGCMNQHQNSMNIQTSFQKSVNNSLTLIDAKSFLSEEVEGKALLHLQEEDRDKKMHKNRKLVSYFIRDIIKLRNPGLPNRWCRPLNELVTRYASEPIAFESLYQEVMLYRSIFTYNHWISGRAVNCSIMNFENTIDYLIRLKKVLFNSESTTFRMIHRKFQRTHVIPSTQDSIVYFDFPRGTKKYTIYGELVSFSSLVVQLFLEAQQRLILEETFGKLSHFKTDDYIILLASLFNNSYPSDIIGWTCCIGGLPINDSKFERILLKNEKNRYQDGTTRRMIRYQDKCRENASKS